MQYRYKNGKYPSLYAAKNRTEYYCLATIVIILYYLQFWGNLATCPNNGLETISDAETYVIKAPPTAAGLRQTQFL